MSKMNTDTRPEGSNKAFLQKLVVAFVLLIYVFIFIKVLFL